METPICFWSNRIGFHIGKGCTHERPVLMRKCLSLIFQHHFHNTSNSYVKKEYSDIPNPELVQRDSRGTAHAIFPQFRLETNSKWLCQGNLHWRRIKQWSVFHSYR